VTEQANASRFTPPFNVDAEAALLGALLINSDVFLDLPSGFSGEAFYVMQHAHIFNAFETIWRKHGRADIVSVAAQMEIDGTLDGVKGKPGLKALIDSCPSERNIPAYAELIQSNSLKRLAIDVSADITGQAMNEQATGEGVLEFATSKLLGVSMRGTQMPEASSVVVPRWMKNIEDRAAHPEKYEYLMTPWSNVNKGYGGLEPGELQIVAGRPGMGKSAFVGQWRDFLAENGIPVAIFSMEMTEHELIARQVARKMKLNSRTIMRAQIPEDRWAELAHWVSIIQQWPIYWDTTGALTLSGAWRKMRALIAKYSVKVMFVDYIQLMELTDASDPYASRMNRARALGQISHGLKAVAKDTSTTVVVTAQLNRAVEHRDDKRPKLADLRESGELEQDASVVWFLYRDDYYNTNSELPNTVEAIKAKDRNGEAPLTAHLGLHKKWTEFYDVIVERKELDQLSGHDPFEGLLEQDDDIGLD